MKLVIGWIIFPALAIISLIGNIELYIDRSYEKRYMFKLME